MCVTEAVEDVAVPQHPEEVANHNTDREAFCLGVHVAEQWVVVCSGATTDLWRLVVPHTGPVTTPSQL
jgi:hypothetical protein